MAEFRRQILITSLTALVIALIIGLAIVYLPIHTPTSNETTFTVLRSSSIDNSHNLEFELSINSSSLHSGQSINIIESVFNNLSTVNTVYNESAWNPSYLLTVGEICPAFSSPTTFVILGGYYTASNVSTATHWLYYFPPPPWSSSCPYRQLTRFVFQPNSNIADIRNGYKSQNFTDSVEANYIATGYYLSPSDTGSNNTLPQFIQFPKGIYTIVGGDEWGDQALLYFTVS